ncbi:Coiled-coil domain-containing protein 65 [Hondaea fermentalgiana]|uniref:Dynein regulatory complex subunit 2 n=1 Tax=Hondaea fermentalgiana TaxID=2315210 RepID=A0A2R5GAA5_9STRA|nr:Coiled-coil domain-containing protein 65 [Hondaea fermentalgiana]|eukprot:GBG25483.1 Coiled-coil domain-containing protein 65 [Hondaea fermentalgiana]
MAVLGKDVKGGKKKGGGKGGKAEPELSDEDRAEEEKRLRLAENDVRKARALQLRARLEREMQQELRNTQTNKLRVQQQWRKILRLAKVESLRNDIEILSQNHERDVDRSDAIIQSLDRDVEEAEEQYQTALRSHLTNIDRLIDQQDARLLALESEFESEMTEIAAEFNAEREQIIQQHKLEKQELLDIVAAVESKESEREAEARQEHEQTREEVRNKNLEDVNILRITLESTIEELERCFESAHLNYLQNTDQRTQDFKFLTRKDNELSKEIEAKIKKIERLQASLSHWRTKISQNAKECDERNGSLRAEKDQINKHFLELKTRMNKFRDSQSARLMDLTKATSSARKKISGNLDLAERILKLAELARKYETQEEKMLPFYESTVAGKDEGPDAAEEEDTTEDHEKVGSTSCQEGKDQVATGGEVSGTEEKEDEGAKADLGAKMRLLQHDIESPAELMEKARAIGPDGKLIDEWQALDGFFKRYNKALLTKLAVDKERERLQNENNLLKAMLKQYLDGVSVVPETLDNPNPLLVVNGRVNLARRAPIVHEVPPTIVDGNLKVRSAPIRR